MFDFLKYIQPGNYYRLINTMQHAVLINKNIKGEFYNPYNSQEAIELDYLYRCLQLGNIPGPSQSINKIQLNTVKSVRENYIFIRRYFSTIQLVYVYVIRILSLKNPIRESVGFFRALFNVKKIDLVDFEEETIKKVDEQVLLHKPLISIIIPTLNRYEYLKDALQDLENQSYKNFEVIVVDQSDPFDEEFYRNWKSDIKYIYQKEKALWLARNTAIRHSKGEFILLFDDDSRVGADWIENHLKCIEYFKISISAGVTRTKVGGGMGKKDKIYHLSEVFDTGNALVKRAVFTKVGLFDRQFERQRMGDSEFGLRCLLNGFNIVANPKAERVHLKVETGGLRQMGSWDALRPKSLFEPRPVPSVLYLIRKYFGNKEAIYYLVKNIPQSYIPYKWKSKKPLKIFSISFFLILLPIAIVGVSKSWILSSKKLEFGPKVDLNFE